MKQGKKIGDGKLPNLYWLSFHGDWLTDKSNPGHFDWAGDTYKDFKRPKALEYGPFKTFEEALSKAERESWRIDSPEDSQEGLHGFCIEDRLTGTIYEGLWWEHWQEKKYRGTHWRSITFSYGVNDDTKYTGEKLGSDFV